MVEVKKSSLHDITAGIPHKDACVVIIKTEWNAAVTDELENGCLRILKTNGITKIITVVVPGAVEIPFAIKAYWDHSKRKKRPDIFIALGCVIKGGTPHFEYVSQSVTQGILNLNLQLPVPTIFAVLTVDNDAQASERIGGIHGHKGEEAALTALKMITYLRSLKK